MVSEIKNYTFHRNAHAQRRTVHHHLRQESADIQDLINDQAELKLLVDGLSIPLGIFDITQNWFHRSFHNSVKLLRSQLHQQDHLLDSLKNGSGNGSLDVPADYVREQYLALKSALRVAYRHRGTALCDADWQSPVYAASKPLELNRHSEGIKEHILDYKRDGHLDSLGYEEEFVAQYASHMGSDKLHAYLTSCGMSAFGALLQWFAQELNMAGNALAVEPMYFENIHLIKSYLPEVMCLAAPEPAHLLKTLRSRQPQLILADAVTNCGAILEHSVSTILTWAAREAKHTVAILIDTTCLPTALLPDGFLAGLPDNVCVAFIESLAKHHQLGMDAVTGGVIMLHAPEEFHASFKKTRARNGANIADSSVGALPRPNRQLFLSRMKRHARNTQTVCLKLIKAIAQDGGIIESVSWLANGSVFAPWYKGSCLAINLRSQWRSIEMYREFEELVIEGAKERSLPLILGTSFGFDVSRLYVTAPSTVFEPPFLRLAVGTETHSQIHDLAEILIEASSMLSQKWKPVSLSTSAATVKAAGPAIVMPAATPDKPGLPESVFIGPDALERYLCPANYAAAPLVELPADLNPHRADGVRMFAKMMPLVPLMNIKSIPAFSMLQQASKRGDLHEVRKLIESSSSNTVLSLSVIARMFGISESYAIVDHNIAPSLTRMLRLFGIEVLMHPGVGHELFGKLEPRSERARRMGEQPGWINPGQYTNPDNPEGFARWLAPDLWAQTGGRLDLISVGLGTCGTMVGVSKALRSYKPDLKVIACCPQAGEAVPGPRERSLLHDVEFDWKSVADTMLELPAKESFAASVSLLRRGILGGPSSGMNYAGALRYIETEKEAGALRQLLNKNGEIWCAFLCCDSPLPHVDEYYDALGEEFFPAVHEVPAQ